MSHFHSFEFNSVSFLIFFSQNKWARCNCLQMLLVFCLPTNAPCRSRSAALLYFNSLGFDLEHFLIFYSKNRWASCNCLQSYKLFFSTFINFSIIADYYDHWWWQRWCINLMFMIIYHCMSDYLSKLGFALGGRHTWTFASHNLQLFQHWRRCQQGQASFTRCFIEWPNP